VNPKARIAQEEIFGPVLAVIKAKDFDDALRIANDTEFRSYRRGLFKKQGQAGKAKKYSTSQSLSKPQVHGRDVGAHPFGGFNMSGTDSKRAGKIICCTSCRQNHRGKSRLDL